VPTNVGYQIPTGATAAQTSQINQAFQSWTSANESINNSFVGFLNVGSGGAPQITITLCNTPGCAPGGSPAVTLPEPPDGHPIVGAEIIIDTTQVPTTDSDLLRGMLHEIGHTMGLDDLGQSGQPNCGMVPGGSVMNQICDGSFALMPTSVTTCDDNGVDNLPDYPPPPCGSCVPPPVDGCQSVDPCTCACVNQWASPILLAVGPTADYRLVGPQQGVWFDLNSDGIPERLGWTRPNDWVGFLALDRNHNGIIDNGQELFGNFTPLGNGQTAANGFQALAYWDSPQAGGNGNGWIDPGDAVWANLRVWIDFNHDGISQPNELFTLSQLNISAISTTYSPEMRRDQFANGFRYRGQFIINGLPRWAYDVYFAVARH